MIRAGLVLAAGRSTRFGEANKLLAPFRGRSLVAHAAESMMAADLEVRIAVVSDPDVAAQLKGYDLIRIDTPAAPQSESLRVGLARARVLGADRLLVALADMPLVSADLLNAVAARCTDATASAATDGTRQAPPACFPQAMFGQLASSQGDRGAGALLHDLAPEALVAARPGVLDDIDTAADLERMEDR